MHTGYDNYWMYNNRRHERVLCFQKNDSFSHPVFTDSYKQMQGMENPNNLCNYIPPNTVARPHQKVPNDQQRVTSSQNMWPSSVCLQPYSSSLSHNYLPNEVCSVQPNSMYNSSQSLQNQVLRNMANRNVNFNVMQNSNYKASADPVNNNQNGFIYKTQTGRIRVKDFSSLNHNTNNSSYNNNVNANFNKDNNYNSLLNSNLQAQEKNYQYHAFNSAAIRPNGMYGSQAQREYANYNSTAMPILNHSYQNYGHSANHQFHLNNGEQYPQPPTTFYQQSAQFTRERLCCNNVQPTTEKPPEPFNKGHYPVPARQNSDGIQGVNEHRVQLNSGGHPNNNARASNTNTFIPSEEINTASQPQPPLPRTTHPARISSIVSVRIPRTEPAAKSSVQVPLNCSEINAVRLSIPKTAQSVTSLSDSSFSESNRNSQVCVTSSSAVSPRSFAHNQSNTQAVEVETREGRGSFLGSDDTRSAAPQVVDRQEPIADCEVIEKSKSSPVESSEDDRRPKMGKQTDPKETVVMKQNETALDCSIGPKEENLKVEKDNFEDDSPVFIEEMDVQIIKSEDDSCDDSSVEELSNPNSSEETELVDNDNVESIDLVISEKPESVSTTLPEALNQRHESDMDDVVLEKPLIAVEDTVEVQKDENEKNVPAAKERCKSEINRDKLDLLIQFLKTDGGPVEIEAPTENDRPKISTPPPKEKGRLQNRRKLNKTFIKKNNNTEREMISLVSYKTPRYSSRRVSTENNSNETAEKTKNGFGKSQSSDNSGHSGNNIQCVSKKQQPEDLNIDSSDAKRQGRNTSEEGKISNETKENCSFSVEDVTREERNIINLMRVFQNLKNHVCGICSSTSPAESIWINVVSGEFRCLNCLKKMMLKTAKNVKNSKQQDNDKERTLKAGGAHKDETGNGKGKKCETGNKGENGFEQKSKCESFMRTKDNLKSGDLKEPSRIEDGMCFENMSGKSKKEDAFAVIRNTEKDQCDSSKKEASDEPVRPTTKFRSDKSGSISSSKENFQEKLRKEEEKEASDSQDRIRKRNNSDEQFDPDKVLVPESPIENFKQNKAVARRKSAQISLSKECNGSRESSNREEDDKKNKKHETFEGRTKHKSSKAEQPNTKEDKTEPKPKGNEDENLVKPNRKRTISDDEVVNKKRRIMKEGSKEKIKRLAENTKIQKEWKDDAESNKTVVEKKREEDGKDWKARRNSEPKEGPRCKRSFEEELNKASMWFESFNRNKKKSNQNQTKSAKMEASDPTWLPPKRAFKEGERLTETKKKNEELLSRKSQLKNTPRKESKHECFACEGDEEAKQKHPSEKSPESFDSKESAGKNAQFKNHKNSKQCLISRLFKGKQNTRVEPGGKVEDKESLQSHGRWGERQSETIAEGSRYHGQTHPKDSNKTAETRSDKRKSSGEEPTNGKRSQQTEWEKGAHSRANSSLKEKKDSVDSCTSDDCTKDVERDPGSNTSDEEPARSTSLLAELMKKTKKLSWSLLGDT